MTVQIVPIDFIAEVWPRVDKFISLALSHSKGDYNAEHAKVYLTNGSWSLVIAIDETTGNISGALIVEFINRPNNRIAFIVAIGGKGVATPEKWAQFIALMKQKGATKIEGAARASVARLWASKLNFTEKYKVMEISI
jgi:hypothetical protein